MLAFDVHGKCAQLQCEYVLSTGVCILYSENGTQRTQIERDFHAKAINLNGNENTMHADNVNANKYK